MTSWLVAIVAGAGFAFLQYGWRSRAAGPRTLVAALLRAAAVALMVAVLLDAPAAPAARTAPWVALDVSASMVRGDSALWRAARDTAASVAPESTFAFGDSVRVAPGGAGASDRASLARPVVDRAIAGGHPIVVVTDGELDDPASTRALPAGSRVVIVPRRALPDAAVSALEAPRAVVSGDTVRVHVTVVAGAAGSPPGQGVLQLDGHDVAATSLDALAPNAERQVELSAVIAGGAGPAVLRAILRVPRDAEPRNDTLGVAIDRARAPSAVFVSTSPDFDSRYALGVLRGALAIPTRAFLRVAAGEWRVEGTLAPATEIQVRTALRDAPVAILHGDTAIFGSPRDATMGPLGLIVPAPPTSGEWYVSNAPISPLAPALAGIAWDSLPPIALATEALTGSWHGLEVRRGREGERRAMVAGSETPRRTVTVAASGLWRWQFRGGASSDAYAALWGSIFDWLVAERADGRAALPDAAAFREGAPIRWRRGSASDSVVAVTLRQWNGAGRVDSMTLRFGSGATMETRPLPVGDYEVTARGGRSLLVVNRGLEWVPRPRVVQAGSVAGGSAAGSSPTMRRFAWVYAVILLALCGEWLMRRELGLR